MRVERTRVRALASPALTAAEIDAIRALLRRAFGDDPEEAFTEDDWNHTLGGTHLLVDLAGEVVAHAGVVEREIHVGHRQLRTGYVEAVAVSPALQRRGLGTRLMTIVNAWIGDHFDLGALGTGVHRFYERLGWETWRGPSYVRRSDLLEPTPDDDGHIMILRTSTTPALDPVARISCEWRPGDVW